MSESLYDFCRKYDRQYLLEEWDSEKNLPLMPDGVTHGSHTMAWWRCGCGHSWQAPVYTRAAGSGCPYCAGKNWDRTMTLHRCTRILLSSGIRGKCPAKAV